MTRLPPRSDEPARTIAVMALIAAEIRRHLGGRRKPHPFDMLEAARSLEAAGLSAPEALPDDPELPCAAATARPEAAAATPQPTAASTPSHQTDLSSPPLWTAGLEAAAVASPQSAASPWPAEKRNFPRNFLFDVKQHQLVIAVGAHADAIIRRDKAAELLGVSLRWFDHNIKRLLTDHAFPPPRDPRGQRRWRAGDIVVWRETNPDATTILRRPRAAHIKTLEHLNDKG